MGATANYGSVVERYSLRIVHAQVNISIVTREYPPSRPRRSVLSVPLASALHLASSWHLRPWLNKLIIMMQKMPTHTRTLKSTISPQPTGRTSMSTRTALRPCTRHHTRARRRCGKSTRYVKRGLSCSTRTGRLQWIMRAGQVCTPGLQALQ